MRVAGCSGWLFGLLTWDLRYLAHQRVLKLLRILGRVDVSLFIMSGGAYGTKAQDTEFRKKWDKEEYTDRAKQKDQEERERMQENEERLKQGASILFCTTIF